MENKSNDFRLPHQEGNEVLNSSLVTIDLNHFISQAKSESSWKESDRNSITVLKSDTLRIVLLGLHKGAELKTHTANGIISVQVVEGCIKFTAEGKTIELQKGQIAVLPQKVPHSVIALQETFFLLTLYMR